MLAAGAAIVAALAGMPWPVLLSAPLVAGVGWFSLERSRAARSTACRERLALATELQRTRATLVGARVGTWVWDLQVQRIVYDEACSAMLGYGHAEIDSTLGSWGKLLHPEDTELARRGIDELCRGTSEHYETRVRLRAADGSWRTILDRGSVVARGPRGEAVQLAGVHIDVTPPAEVVHVRPAGETTRWVVVDDDPSVRLVIERVLSRVGISVATFADPHSALAAILASPPVGIVTDFDMPGMSGVELAKRVRAAGHECAVVLVTGSDATEVGDSSVADRVLRKPFAVHDLVAAVERSRDPSRVPLPAT